MDATLRARQIARIQEWMRAILAPNQVVEVRTLRPFASRIFALADPSQWESLAHFASSRSGECGGVYYTPNPLLSLKGSGKDGTAIDADIASRRWLLVDVDPDRPKETNASEAERNLAFASARTIRETLDARGFGGIVEADSGNGSHLMIPVDMPNDDASKASHKLMLELFRERFGGNGLKFDSVYNAARIWKMPGTLAMKGEHSPERPQRYSRIVTLPESPHRFAAGNAVALGKLLDDWNRGRKKHASDDREQLIRRAVAYLEKEPPAVSGQRGHDRAFHVACVLVVEFGLNEHEAYEAIQSWNARCTPPWSEKELRHKLDGAAKQPGERGRLAGDRAATPPKSSPAANPSSNGSHTTPAAKPDDWPRPIIIRAIDVKTKKVEWLWPWRIPLGKLTTFAGVTGLGKTFTLCDISARVSRGLEWPGMAGECAPLGQVVFISGEDEPDDTLVPRMIEMGADLNRITFLQSAALDRFTLADLPALDAALEDTGDDVKLVVIDPPTAYLGKVNDHRNAELRGVLSPLKTWAAKYNVAIVFNTHVNKPQAAKVDAMMRVMGSVAWVNAVRAAHLFTAHPDEEDQRLFVPIKLNVGKMAKGLAYKIEVTPELAKLVWGGEVDLTANEALNNDRKPRREIATEWLIEQFRVRLEWPSDELFRAAKESGVSRNAIFEAKATLNPKVKPSTNQDGSKSWIWSVPHDWDKFGEKKPYQSAYGSQPATERERAY